MNVVYAIISIAGWAWCIVALIFLLLKLRRNA